MRYSICVSGAASGDSVTQSHDAAERIARAIAKSGHVTTTGATVGLPFYAARAARKAHGMSIGFSPASSIREHVFKYRLPIGVYDYIIYTGMNYVGRDVYLVQSSDAVITVGGRFGSLHEFTTAFENGTICGVLLDSGGAADVIPDLVKSMKERLKSPIIFDDNPESLVKKIIDILDQHYGDIDVSGLANQWYLSDPTNNKRYG